MGVNQGAKTLYHLLLLTMANVAAIVHRIHQYQESVYNGLTMFASTIAGDINNICHRVGGKFSSSIPSSEVILEGMDDDLPLFLAIDIFITGVSITPFDCIDH